jgi:hypothetical protein
VRYVPELEEAPFLVRGLGAVGGEGEEEEGDAEEGCDGRGEALAGVGGEDVGEPVVGPGVACAGEVEPEEGEDDALVGGWVGGWVGGKCGVCVCVGVGGGVGVFRGAAGSMSVGCHVLFVCGVERAPKAKARTIMYTGARVQARK